MPSKSVQIGYLLGLSLLLTSIVYFFAANWSYFDRLTKVCLSVALLLFFYSLHFLFRKYSNKLQFLSNWLFVATGIVFGVVVAIIGQVYNSHADNYQLFLVWLIPILLCAILTKYRPFYVLTFVLAHVSIYFFLFPSAYSIAWNNIEILVMLFGIVILDAVIFYLFYKNILESKTILYLSFIMFHIACYFIVLNESLPLHFLTNIVYIFVFIISFYYWYKKHLQRALLVITGVFASGYILYRGIYWVTTHYGELALLFLLLFAAGLVFTSLIIVSVVKKGKMNRFLIQFIIITITIIATLFATFAITGLFFLMFPEATADALYFFALIALIAPGLFIKLPNQIRYTLLGTGFVLGFTSGLFTFGLTYFYLLFILLCIGLYIVKMAGIRVLIYLLINIVLARITVDLFSFEMTYLLLFILNVGYYVVQMKDRATKNTAIIVGYINFFILTFLDVAIWLQIVYNLAFFLVVTSILIFVKRESYKWEWTVSFIFWFLFLGYTYYEYLWPLVHKSILFLVLGLIFLGISYYFDQKSEVRGDGSRKIQYRLSLLLAVILLQFGFIGYQVTTNETLLKHGELIKLELEPVDPRSMMQGDYIQLRYTISDLDENIKQTSFHKQKIKVVLREQDGIFQYAGFYQIGDQWNKPYEQEADDVLINGVANSPHHITYGIESFFIPDGSGLQLENEIDYAYVRVGKTGNAIIERVD